MNHTRSAGLRYSAAVAALFGLASLAVPAAAQDGKSKTRNNAYIVQMAEAPVTAYQGGVAGFAATKPGKGQKIDPNSSAVRQYKSYLESRHNAALGSVGVSKKLYSYGYVFNGFAADLTEAQAQKLGQTPGVLAVTKDEAYSVDTATTPAFIGLSGPTGFWNTKAKGENVIIGIVDGGIWPEHPSFSDRTGSNGNGTQGDKLDYQQIPGWHGKCTPGDQFNASHCNQKLIGARYYNAAWGGNAGIAAQLPWEYNSPRDFGGHGTHTASTAGGNAGVPATGVAASLGAISGIAPRARIASYKVCWQTPAGGSCFPSDSVAAIDQAVADGVDVINFSISGSRTSFRDPVEIAFLFAADAGVFVAASAGNSGPTTSTVAHPSPWLTTVAAGTHNRNGAGSATLGSGGATMFGASYAAALGPRPLVHSVAAGVAGADAATLALCFGTADDGVARLDPARVAGKIVVCERGGNVLVNKAAAVQAAGGVGMILVNTPTSATTQLAILYTIPAVHLAAANYAALAAYAATPGATATINQAGIVLNAAAPFTASFSSRGPLLASGSMLKPDIIAPGQDILAGVAPPGNSGKLFDLYSGTSMSSPHVAGLAALMKELKPGWSPMAIKSALMTTATDVLDGGTPPAAEAISALIFRQGAGHVQPNSAADPGLVFDSAFPDWLSFICGVQPGGGCTGVAPMNPSNLNVPSIAVGALAGSPTLSRPLTNVGAAGTYTASVNMPGFTVVVSPASFHLAAGESRSFTVTITRTTAALNSYGGGQLRLSNGVNSVRVPMVVRPVALAAPVQVSGSYNVTFGYTGPFGAAARGLVPAAVTAGTVADDPTDGACSLTSPNAVLIQVPVPLGTTYARFALFDADVSPGADIDLCVFNAIGTQIGGSGSGTSAEEVNIGSGTLDIGGTTYTVVVQGWGVVGSSPFKLHTWTLGVAAAGNMAVSAPPSATTGATGAIGLTFSGLTPATKYLGSVAYSGVSGMPNPTIVRVDPP